MSVYLQRMISTSAELNSEAWWHLLGCPEMKSMT